jgi:hypothetical protein
MISGLPISCESEIRSSDDRYEIVVLRQMLNPLWFLGAGALAGILGLV